MSKAGHFTRRSLLMLPLLASGAWASPEKRKPKAGTGGDSTGLDNGIGGTGVVGTIRGFGSIIVNNLRITYPDHASVTIDDAPARISDMRVGHVARVVAKSRGGHYSTSVIAIYSEVVGPIESIDDRSLVVLGQNAEVNEDVSVDGLSVGDWVALSGLRRVDQTLCVSLIEKRNVGEARVAGILRRNLFGQLAVGSQTLRGQSDVDLGRRILARGRLLDGALELAAIDPDPLEPLGVDEIALESYVALEGEDLVLAEGRSLPVGSSLNASGLDGLTIITAKVTDGSWRVTSITPVAAPTPPKAQSVATSTASKARAKSGAGKSGHKK